MLDFVKLMVQIDEVGRDSIKDSTLEEERLELACSAWRNAMENPDQFMDRLESNAAWVLWPVATPLETQSANMKLLVEPQYDPVTVVAVDGSQIMPSHHEVHNCFLLNVGAATISYGTSNQPAILESFPRLYHRPEDLYPLVDRRRIHIDELYVSLERGLLELETIVQNALNARSRNTAIVAFVDGSLLPWSVEKMPTGYQETYIARVEESLRALKDAGIPIVGYLSHSRSSDAVNCLRVSICPFELSDCLHLCSHLNEEDFPCSRIWPLTDRQLLQSMLRVQERSIVFQSGASVSKYFDQQQRTCFCYLHVGSEIARLEFPRWVFEDKLTLAITLRTSLAQAAKGMGYPVCLAEAHHLAVIKGSDREKFFELMTKHLIGLGQSKVRLSPKETRKRTSFV